ncbi:MAG: HAMP domain-containing histidine kinase [Chloroflexi bacterium]|nr:HAMP domain-containing histidine kinase [Chloroflexota bacterium]
MPDGILEPGLDATEGEALAADGQLLRAVGRRLVAWAAGTTLLMLLVLAAALYLSVSSSLEASGVQQLDRRADALRDFTSGPRPHPDGDDPPTGLIFGGGTSGTFALILDVAGVVVAPRDQPLPTGMPNTASLAAAVAGADGRDVRFDELGETPVRVMTRRIQSDNVTLYAQIYQDRTAEQRMLDAVLAVLLAGGVVILVVAVGFGTVYSRRALVPIRDSLTAQRRALRRQRAFAADASHELRTPLTVIRASLEHLRRHKDQPVATVGAALDDIGAEVDQLTRLVEELLLLARSDSGAIQVERLPVDLGDVAADAASSLAGPAAERGVAVTVDPEPALVIGDAARLRQLVMILVDNAVAHSPRDAGRVDVVVRIAGRDARLTVEDNGRGLREEDLPRLFERFWRGAGAPPGGAGLGLSIAAWITDQHGGTIAAENRPEGGARFIVIIPLAAEPETR